jgi:ABC-type lipoprotein export system ATPase subunit
LENLEMAGLVASTGKKHKKSELKELLEKRWCSELGSQITSQLSVGQQQRVSCSCFVNEPKVLWQMSRFR